MSSRPDWAIRAGSRTGSKATEKPYLEKPKPKPKPKQTKKRKKERKKERNLEWQTYYGFGDMTPWLGAFTTFPENLS